MPLDLVVPDLLLPVDAPEALRAVRLAALERWLARGERARRPEGNLAALLSSAYALPSPPPIAAIALAADDSPQDGTWLRADPVHLRVNQDAVSLHDPSVLEITREEAGELIAALEQHFRDDPLEFLAPAPDRWYVRVPQEEMPRTVSLDDALGRNVFGLLPKGSGKFNWPSALTETQMLFASHEVNARRETEGKPAINSVWFWGEGTRPSEVAKPYALVYANNAFARGLAALSGTRHAAPPASVANVDAVRESESALVVLDDLSTPLRRGDETEWQRLAAKLDQDWFVDLGRAIERFDAVRIILPVGKDTLVVAVGPSTKWRWFRSVKPVATYA